MVDTVIKENYKSAIFGPINSRRLGISLGLNIIPHKTCSLDCIYCECGKTTNLSIDFFKYLDPDKVLSLLKEKLQTIKKIDYITFSGSGEPTLNIDFPYYVKQLKSIFSNYKIALLTNSTTLIYSSVFNASLLCDLVIPSIDSVINKSFQKIDRPHESINLEAIKNKLIEFSSKFKNKLWLEVFIADGVNSSSDDIKSIYSFVKNLKYEKIQFNSIDRAGTEAWVKPISKETTALIAQVFFGVNYEIIGKKA